jgi:DNA-binding PadR family transcriptional regulator
MRKATTDLPRVTLDLLILKALALEPLNGVGIARRIHQMTNRSFQVSFGSLFPSVHRMEEKEWVVAEWRASENNHRATGSGQPSKSRDWNRVVEAMTAALRHPRITAEEG